MLIPNKDSRLDDPAATPPLHRPRPGHADLAGSVKWLTTDCRETLERASARETAARVAAGALSRCLLREFGIEVFGFVRAVGPADEDSQVTPDNWRDLLAKARRIRRLLPRSRRRCRRCASSSTSRNGAKDTAGGIVEAHVFGCPIGLGSCMTMGRPARLAASPRGHGHPGVQGRRIRPGIRSRPPARLESAR
jgi:chorismate synthase